MSGVSPRFEHYELIIPKLTFRRKVWTNFGRVSLGFKCNVIPQPTRPNISFILLSFVILHIASEVSATDFATFWVFVVSLAILGKQIIDVLVLNESPLTKWCLGSLVGIFFGTAADQLLRVIHLRWLYEPVVYLMALIVLWRWTKQFRLRAHKNVDLQLLSDSQTISFLILILLSQTWSWLKWPAFISLVVLCIGMLLWNKDEYVYSKILMFGVIATSCAVVIATQFRSTDWWFPGYGLDELEYLSHAAYQWGPTMDVLVANEKVGYQWFGFATLGLLERASGVSDFVVGTRFDFIFSALLVAAFVLAICQHFLRATRESVFAAIITCLMTTTMFYPNPWGVFVVNLRGFQAATLLGVILATIVWGRNDFSTRSFVPLAIAAFALVNMKTASLFPIEIALGVGCIRFLARRRFGIVFKIILLSLLLLASTLLTIRGSSGMEFTWREPFSLLDNYFSRSNRLSRIGGPSWGLVFVIMWGLSFVIAMLIPGLVVIGWFRRHLSSSWALPALIAPMVCGAFMASLASRRSDTQLHFLQVVVTIAMIFVAIQTVESLQHVTPVRRRASLWGCLALGGIAFAIPVIAQHSSIGLPGFEAQMGIVGAVAASVVFLFLIVGTIATRLIDRTWARVFAQFTTVGVASFFVVCGMTNRWVLDRQPMFNSGIVEGQMGSSDLQAVARWIDTNTSADAILATNMFQPEESKFADTCAISVSEGRSNLVELVSETDYLALVTMTKRRYLVASPKSAAMVMNISLDEKIEKSIYFGCEPTERRRRQLRDLGVDWYIAYLPTTVSRFSFPDRVRFEIGPFKVVQLG